MKRSFFLLITALGFAQLMPVAPIASAGGGGSGSLEAERLERQQLEDSAYEAYWRGIEAKKAGDYVQAGADFRSALDILPQHEGTEKYRRAIAKEFGDVCVKLAHQRAVEGSLRDANRYVDVALEYSPEHEDAQAMKKKLADPEWYNPGVTPGHLKKVDRVNRNLREGDTNRRQGKFDQAEDKMYEVLRDDKYNDAARNGIARVERDRTDYLDAAHDHTRAKLLADLSSHWATRIPPRRGLATVDSGVSPAGGDFRQDIQRKLNTIIIDQFNLNDATLEAALGALKLRAIDLDPDKQGFDYVVQATGEPLSKPISLSLHATPLRQVLQYVCDFVGARYVVDNKAIRIVGSSQGAGSEEMVSRRYKVPPSFEKIPVADAATAPVDPFAAGAGAGARPSATAEDILKGQGIKFEAGARAFYIRGSSTLAVTNTRSQIELVDAFVDGIQDDAPKQVEVESKFIEVRQDNQEELGFDWMLGGFGFGSGDQVLGGGGVVGNSKGIFDIGPDGTQFPFTVSRPGVGGAPPVNVPLGENPVTSGLRTGSQLIAGNAIDTLIQGFDRSDVTRLAPAPGIFSLAGILTDPQFQMVMRGLSQRKSVDLLTAPMIVTKSGSRAKIEVIRELLYPTEYDPPELPQQVSATGAGLPVTPAHPTTFVKRDTGVSLEVDPAIGPDGYQVDLQLAPQVVEFEGFVNYGSPISVAGTDALGNAIELPITENRIDMPVFATRKAVTNVTIYDGHAVAIGGLAREDVQHGTDKVPIIGDLPYVGRFFRSESEQRLKRNLMIFVKVRLLDPTGQAVREQRAAAAAELPTIE